MVAMTTVAMATVTMTTVTMTTVAMAMGGWVGWLAGGSIDETIYYIYFVNAVKKVMVFPSNRRLGILPIIHHLATADISSLSELELHNIAHYSPVV